MTPTTTDPTTTDPTTTLAAEAARLEALDGGLDAVLEGFFAADHDAADHEAVADRAEVESPPVAVDPDEADIDSFDHYELFFACLDPEPVGEPEDDGS